MDDKVAARGYDAAFRRPVRGLPVTAVPTRIVRVLIRPDPPARLDKALARDVPEAAALSRSRIARLIAEGRVRRGGLVLDDPRARVAEGEELELAVTDDAVPDLEGEAIPLVVVHEDDDLIVIDKLAGMVVHPAPGAPAGTLVNALIAHCGESLSGIGGERRPGIVHRIDKDTSGLLVAAKSDRAHHGLARQFEAHAVDRHYRALVHGVPDAGDPRLAGLAGVGFEPGGVIRIATAIGRHPTDRQRQAVLASGGRHAVTRARVVEIFGNPPAAALIDCWLETGRTHQIRVHMAHIGHPVIGDRDYGQAFRTKANRLPEPLKGLVNAFPRQALHAELLAFRHPATGKLMRFHAEMPDDMLALVEEFRGLK